MAKLIRDVVKYVRDRAKSRYDKQGSCYICGTTEELDFHHFSSMTENLQKWLQSNGITINSAEDIIEVRDDFIKEYNKEIYEDCVTICHTHHLKLHSIYGKRPELHTAPKQARWVEKQRIKHGLV